MRPALAAAALIKQHDSIALRIEKGPHLRVGAATRTAVQEYRRLTLWIATFFEVDFVHVRYAQKSGAKRLDGRIQAPTVHRHLFSICRLRSSQRSARRLWLRGGSSWSADAACR